MSYNISNWKTKKIKSFKIPLNQLIILQHATVELVRIDFVKATGAAEDFEISGKLIDGLVEVEEICLMGEGSGTAWQDQLKDLLTASSGYLSALLVWEDGDSISTLEVKDGAVEDNELEL